MTPQMTGLLVFFMAMYLGRGISKMIKVEQLELIFECMALGACIIMIVNFLIMRPYLG